ncbi:GNAT family N-acetyltransferase [Gemella sp. GH3]|uniref:GNAT family N-acetyltransferase n=1 Tax=unclassified Gemella TaxID=2624949 RepID=UPI0015D06276|nr:MULTISPECIES: GNAT family protein [unclassified Gemella]MBF0714155.1 GNAT family N-acetyltransferase [Gemella sp. GH3.1]NYS51107.1 GNAT family N-acetyltransferase [Gemella sp. GH3]
MIEIKPVTQEKDIYRLWEIGFSRENMEWTKWNGPYFDDYKVYTYEQFKKEMTFYRSSNNWGIFVDNQLVGMLFRYWECEKTRWLEIGIVIYDENCWDKKVGRVALSLWIDKTFVDFTQIEHIGLTTWSGNIRMMRVSERLGMKQEACIRKVRYWEGVYYDSVKYGILREEWENHRAQY